MFDKFGEMDSYKEINAEETEDDMEDVIRDFYVSEGIIKKAVAVKDNPKDLRELIAPAQKSPKPALIPSEEEILKEDKKPIIRWDKMKFMSIPEVAEILHLGYKSRHLTFNSITDVENWLNEELEK